MSTTQKRAGYYSARFYFLFSFDRGAHAPRVPVSAPRRNTGSRHIWFGERKRKFVAARAPQPGRRGDRSPDIADAVARRPYHAKAVREGCDLLFPVNAFAFDRALLAGEVNFDRQHFSVFGDPPDALAFELIGALGCLDLRLFEDIHAFPVSGPARGAEAVLRRSAGKHRRGKVRLLPVDRVGVVDGAVSLRTGDLRFHLQAVAGLFYRHRLLRIGRNAFTLGGIKFPLAAEIRPGGIGGRERE